MPFRKRKRSMRRSKRRSSKRRRTGSITRGYRSVLIRSPEWFPDAIRVKHELTINEALTVGTASLSSLLANGLFQPGGAAAMSPNGVDEIGVLYQRYRVLGCSIKVTLSNNTVNTGINYVLIANKVISGGLIADINSNPRTKHGSCGGRQGMSIVNYGMYATTKQVSGSPYAITDIENSANAGSNPLNQWFFQLFFESADGATPMTADILVVMKFYTEWFNRIPVTRST